MKKTLFYASALLLLVMSSCQKDDNSSDSNLEATLAQEAMNTFFDSTLASGMSVLEGFFESSSLSYNQDTCFLVNSSAELERLYTGDKELPEIDFGKNTLLIGRFMETAGLKVVGQTVDVSDESIVITLMVDHDDGDAYIAAMVNYYFWALYDKVTNKKTVIKIEKVYPML